MLYEIVHSLPSVLYIKKKSLKFEWMILFRIFQRSNAYKHGAWAGYLSGEVLSLKGRVWSPGPSPLTWSFGDLAQARTEGVLFNFFLKGKITSL